MVEVILAMNIWTLKKFLMKELATKHLNAPIDETLALGEITIGERLQLVDSFKSK